MGWANEIVNIPSKLTPELEALRSRSLPKLGRYVFDWTYHANGDNSDPVDLHDDFWTDGLGVLEDAISRFRPCETTWYL